MNASPLQRLLVVHLGVRVSETESTCLIFSPGYTLGYFIYVQNVCVKCYHCNVYSIWMLDFKFRFLIIVYPAWVAVVVMASYYQIICHNTLRFSQMQFTYHIKNCKSSLDTLGTKCVQDGLTWSTSVVRRINNLRNTNIFSYSCFILLHVFVFETNKLSFTTCMKQKWTAQRTICRPIRFEGPFGVIIEKSKLFSTTELQLINNTGRCLSGYIVLRNKFRPKLGWEASCV